MNKINFKKSLSNLLQMILRNKLITIGIVLISLFVISYIMCIFSAANETEDNIEKYFGKDAISVRYEVVADSDSLLVSYLSDGGSLCEGVLSIHSTDNYPWTHEFKDPMLFGKYRIYVKNLCKHKTCTIRVKIFVDSELEKQGMNQNMIGGSIDLSGRIGL